MSNEQRNQASASEPSREAAAETERKDFAKKGALAAIGGAFSGIFRAGTEAARDAFWGGGS